MPKDKYRADCKLLYIWEDRMVCRLEEELSATLNDSEKELMSQDEIAVMDGGKCIMQLRGVRPFFSDKFDITKHSRYKELSCF